MVSFTQAKKKIKKNKINTFYQMTSTMSNSSEDFNSSQWIESFKSVHHPLRSVTPSAGYSMFNQ